ncbi:MAG TPA: response regulator [Allosphingosinicella sp.]|nr:response regulator [Allosphingosinicella sp.]
MDTPDSLSSPPRVLIVDDDPDIVKSASLMLSRRGYEPVAASNPAEAWSLLAEQGAEIVLLDLNFSAGKTNGEEGLSFLDRLFALDRSLVVVVVTGHSGVNIAVAAIRAGAQDFLMKPWNNARFAATIDSALAERRRRVAAAESVRQPRTDVLLVGESAAVEWVRQTILRVAPTEAGILLHGPAGSGKSLVARAIHSASRRSTGPVSALDLTALDRVGTGQSIASALRSATGGTLVLDHLDQLPGYGRQPLLTALDDGSADIRLLATARDRARLFGAEGPGGDLTGRFAIEIKMPAVSERGDDAVLLAKHFLRLAARRNRIEPKPLSPEAEAAVLAATWPDGIRELAAAMERAAIMADGPAVEPGDLTLDASDDRAGDGERLKTNDPSLAAAERAVVGAALRRHSFNVTRAATDLGITRAALYRRMAKHGF